MCVRSPLSLHRSGGNNCWPPGKLSMPTRPKQPCAHPGCPNRKPCPIHKRQRTEDTRPSAAERGYDQKWRRTRAAFLKKHPTCVGCGGDASEVDHIVPLKDGGTNEWSNLQAMCKSCHSNKTNTFDGGFGNKGRGSQKSTGFTLDRMWPSFSHRREFLYFPQVGSRARRV